MNTRPRLLDLPDGTFTVIDGADWPIVRGLTLYRGQNGYVYFSTWKDGKSHPQLLHRLLTNAPKGRHVDHINGDKLDNRRSTNLRVVTPQINQVNRKRLNKNNTSGIRGVQWLPHWNRWRAQITVSKRNYHLGLFKTKDEAIEARRAAEVREYGETCPSHGF